MHSNYKFTTNLQIDNKVTNKICNFDIRINVLYYMSVYNEGNDTLMTDTFSLRSQVTSSIPIINAFLIILTVHLLPNIKLYFSLYK